MGCRSFPPGRSRSRRGCGPPGSRRPRIRGELAWSWATKEDPTWIQDSGVDRSHAHRWRSRPGSVTSARVRPQRSLSGSGPTRASEYLISSFAYTSFPGVAQALVGPGQLHSSEARRPIVPATSTASKRVGCLRVIGEAMTDQNKTMVPVWALATGDVQVPGVSLDEPMSADRLNELRGVLATLADQPIATLEVHTLRERVDRRGGIALDAASPLAQHLSELIKQTARGGGAPVVASNGGDVLYRMVVPAKVAAEVGQGIVRPMRSRAVAGAIRGPLMGAKGVVGQASFVPVRGAATAAGRVGAAAGGAGAAAGAAGGAGAAAAGGAALTVAAPLVLMAVAVGVSARAEQQRREAIEHIAELLEGLHEEKLNDERNALDGCRDAIDKATAILLDQGKLGVSLGLDSAVHAIGTALAAAERRLGRWQEKLDEVSGEATVELATLTETFAGIDGEGGEFRAHLELAALAIALKRRVIVLQAVENAQTDEGNPFINFTRALKADQQRLDKLESEIGSVLQRISRIQLTRPQGLRAPVFTSREVDRLMDAAYRIRELGEGLDGDGRPGDVAIEIARESDGSLVVMPAVPA